VTSQIVAWGFLFILIATVVLVGWWQIREGGKRIQRLKEAKEDQRELQDQLDRRNQPIRDDVSHAARLRKLLKARKSMRDRETRD